MLLPPLPHGESSEGHRDKPVAPFCALCAFLYFELLPPDSG
jgi:hypothetical protein